MRIGASTRGNAIAAASGLVFAASSPPLDIAPGILFGLFGYAVALGARAPADAGSSDARGVLRRGAARGFWFAFAANVVALRFVSSVIARFTPLPFAVGIVALVLLAAAQAAAWMLGGAVSTWLSARGQRPFLAFALGVLIAVSLPAVFPWTPAGGLTPWPLFVQTADLVGERGASFLLAAVCGLFAEAARSSPTSARARARALVAAAVLLVLVLGYGALRMAGIDRARAAAPRARVAVLDPDFDAMFRWDGHQADAMLGRLDALTRDAEAAGAVLTVWPESAYPHTLPHGVKHSPRDHRAVLRRAHGPVLTGAYLSKGDGIGTNSAILVEANAAEGGVIGPSYDKRHLLWFGETVPLADTFPVLGRIFARGTGLVAGTSSVAFRPGTLVIAVLNCYEDTLSEAGREAMTVRPNVLVNVTNDAWFFGTPEGELHLRLSVMRAIETRRDLLRSVNRGQAAWIDASGRVVMRQDANRAPGRPEVLITEPALLDAPTTLYVRLGELPLRVLAVLVVALAWLRHRGRAWLRHRRKSVERAQK